MDGMGLFIVIIIIIILLLYYNTVWSLCPTWVIALEPNTGFAFVNLTVYFNE